MQENTEREPESTPTEKNKPADAMAGKVKETYEWWNNLATINEEDPLWVGAAKIGVRLFGILILLALSPLILVGFLMAFIAAA
ncbi:hypothetical protein [Lewinella sp. 4G2]|uniref:hypothetical protein n=1 Tax=Lewinella sp. 4G2 TaxID=1803372 RepID=UPI0007B4A95C|nr:hypothetical protein [Lewinella sp. 4G2]OAV44198.1 hypothetical protein A3850_006685 [Lewinella sp. 4G2]